MKQLKHKDMKNIVFLIALLFYVLAASAQKIQRERPWSINASGGYAASSGADIGLFNIGVQRHLSKYFSAGGGTGMYYFDGVVIPVYADVRGYYPFENSKFSLIGIVRTGVGIHTNGGSVVFGFDVLPGVGLKITNCSFLHLNIGICNYDSRTIGAIQLGYSYSW